MCIFKFCGEPSYSFASNSVLLWCFTCCNKIFMREFGTVVAVAVDIVVVVGVVVVVGG